MPVRSRQVLVLAQDPDAILAAHAASARLGLTARTVGTGSEALARLVRPGLAPGHLVCDPAAAGATWPRLLALLAEPATGTALVLLGPSAIACGADPVPGDAALLAEAMAAGPLAGAPGDGTVAALRQALQAGEIGVHYQPIVRVADRRPVLVEALARWHRAGQVIGPDAFVALAEQAGLAPDLAAAVAGAAIRDLSACWPRLRLGVTLNLPLALLLDPGLPARLGRLLARAPLPRRQVVLELTETTPVHDLAALARALRRLRHAGFGVLLDDVALGDGRWRLHALPFAGLKLDRSLAERLSDAACRQAVRRLVREARARGQVVTAEGVADRRHWAALRALGVHQAQGYGIGRPLPATALPGWRAAWRARRAE
ncbi:EAL domain-containing protein [Paracraurococcus ruber]|uniref:EAL domain-containing protein n=1 Tax=Paracraurococcus ruber TaxID=77675 RepID=A0ABS1D149_9PROT|nr:EAL domain-containing protein [Paracraurococcus ruber]MBK1660286.1 hypothetical protein [Paracraurococcus ruber]TDG31576.1 EAL domain-containing protein [Paracraurococcus ruber]